MDIVGFKTLEQSSTVTIPMELIFSCILPKLPAKSLFRFKCVSKSFLNEISSPKFSELFSDANHRLLILPGQNRTFRIYDMDSLNSPPTLCPYPIPPKWNESRIWMLACCESYFLIKIGTTRPGFLILLNPATRIYRRLPQAYNPPRLLSPYVRYGMCHCSDEFNNDDFKVARFRRFKFPPIYGLMYVTVYSLKTNSWKYIEGNTTTTDESIENPVLVQNHLLVMICYSSGRMMRIGCFDMKAERWSNDVPLSDILLGEINSNPNRDDGHYHLGVLEGRLHFSCYDENKSTYNIWVMEEYGVKESWVKLMSLPGQGLEGVYHPIAYRKGSLHEILCIPNYSGKYFWYNLRDKTITYMGLHSEGLNSSRFAVAYICKGSLLNFSGGRPIPSLAKEQEKAEDDDDEMNIFL